MARPRVAILDDYQRVALASADWGGLDADIHVFHESMGSEDQAAALLEPFEIVSLMRERTPFPASLIARLPRLKLLSMTGHRSTILDTAACGPVGPHAGHRRPCRAGCVAARQHPGQHRPRVAC